jgi:hypothetical protein
MSRVEKLDELVKQSPDNRLNGKEVKDEQE